MGAYFSDLISYAMGRYLGPVMLKIKFFANALPEEKINTVQKYFNKYGILTLIIGRFIPFGVRNPMFMTAGLSKMNAAKFAIGDFIASTLTVGIYFYLYFTYGEVMVLILKKFNILDRHFLNKVCTHIADIDFQKVSTYAGNYDFWRRSSELAMQLRSNERKKAEDKAKELKSFIQRFSANASKSTAIWAS